MFYDDLDPRCLDTGVVRLSATAYPALWDQCEESNLKVVADVHTHPGTAGQSQSDRAHPMIARPGHVAIIVPRFASGDSVEDIGIHRFLGVERWQHLPARGRRAGLYIGRWG